MSLPRFSARRPVAVAMLFLAIALLGAIAWTRLPLDLLPDLGYPRLAIATAYPGVAPAEVERLVTEPVEAHAAAVPGVEQVGSVTRAGSSLVTLRFAWGTDMDYALLAAREQMDDVRAALPEGASRPRLLRVDPESDPVMALAVSGPADLGELRRLAETVIRRRLEQLDGVAQAAVIGGLEREIEVRVDPERLAAYDLGPGDVARALDRANVSAPAGTLRQGRYRYPLRTVGELRTVDEIADVVVALPMVRVRDVGAVVDGFAERASSARLNGREAVGLLLFKEAGASTVAVAERVEGVLAQLRREHAGLELEVASSQAGFISAALGNVAQEVIVGGALAFLVLFLFLRDPRYPVVVSMAMPVSVLATFALLDATGVSLNLMSLGGLALGVGMLVDNSIVVLENVFRHRELGASPAEAAAAGAEEVSGAITASTLTTIGVFAPVVYVDGVAGELFRDLALAIAFSLLASLLVALSLLPAWAARLEVGGGERAALARPWLDALDRAYARFARWYHGRLEWALDRPGPVLAGAALALGLAAAVGLALPRDLLPPVDPGALEVRIELPDGADLVAAGAAAALAEDALAADPGVEAVFSRIGRGVDGVGGADARAGSPGALVEARVARGVSTDAVVARVRPVAGRLSDAVVTVQPGRTTALARILESGPAPIAVRVRGQDLGAARARAAQVAARLVGLDRLADVRVDGGRDTRELRVRILRERAAAHGLDPRAVADAVVHGTRGARATELVDFDRRVDVVVRYPEELRRARAGLATLRVDGVPLRELVRVDEVVAPDEVRREDQGRVVTVYADVTRGGLDAAIAAVESALRDLPPAPGLRVEVGGANEEMRRSFRALLVALGLAGALVYMVLAAQFESLVHPFTALAAVPLAGVGAVLALVLTGRGIDTMSLIGLVVLVGIVDNDAIVKIDFINQARAAGRGVREAILEAGRARLRPILMTTVTTVAGLLPMALGLGRGGDLQAPVAIVVVGGLTVATLLTLVVLPVLYLLVERARGGGA